MNTDTNHSRRVEAVDAWLVSKGIIGGASALLDVDPATRELEELRAENERLLASCGGLKCARLPPVAQQMREALFKAQQTLEADSRFLQCIEDALDAYDKLQRGK